MKPIEYARKMSALQKKEKAQNAYLMVLQQEDKTPEEELEAAVYLFFSGADYHVPFSAMVYLYNRGEFQSDCLSILTQGFYDPNKKQMQRLYEKNCRLLQKYPYLFRKDFVPFEELPLRFYPYDDDSYMPFNVKTARFESFYDAKKRVISRNFFHDLDKPILADDVFSQYELEYLNDNVRKSEWVGRENHIYLHYTSWPVFCAYLQCINLRPLLESKKFVFLIEDEIEQYPIDFKARFGIDYSQYPVKPVGIREVTRLIWHTQLSSHNGGDFFNEILYGHPNVISYTSIMYDSLMESLKTQTDGINARKTIEVSVEISEKRMRELAALRPITLKDTLVANFLGYDALNTNIDPAARITPAIMLQPHFHNMIYELRLDTTETAAVLLSKQYDEIRNSPLFRQFKYVKTFTPMRRLTTSYGATVRFMESRIDDGKTFPDVLLQRVLNRSFMVGPQDTLYQDSILVRFEDGKLNPTATFKALAAFLDLPYTESMTYCSDKTGVNPGLTEGWVAGFDSATVYRTYDEYADDAERALIEALMKDVYTQYGYDFQYYHGEELTEEWLDEALSRCDCLYEKIRKTFPTAYEKQREELSKTMNADVKDDMEKALEDRLNSIKENRRRVAQTLLKGLRFVNQNGQPLHFMKMLELDPELLEQPLYR